MNNVYKLTDNKCLIITQDYICISKQCGDFETIKQNCTTEKFANKIFNRNDLNAFIYNTKTKKITIEYFVSPSNVSRKNIKLKNPNQVNLLKEEMKEKLKMWEKEETVKIKRSVIQLVIILFFYIESLYDVYEAHNGITFKFSGRYSGIAQGLYDLTIWLGYWGLSLIFIPLIIFVLYKIFINFKATEQVLYLEKNN